VTTTTPKVRFTLTVEALPDPLAKVHGEKYERDPAYRLKVLLKLMLRRFGMKAVKVTTEPH
jgi:hypothetical protein